MKTYKERTDAVLKKSKELERARAERKKKIARLSVFGGIAAAFVAFILVLFVPYTVGDVNIKKYKNSEYYTVMQRVKSLTYPEPRRTTNFNEWFGHLFEKKKGASSDGSGAGPAVDVSEQYKEVTDNQADGVIEGDLFKRSSEYIFYLECESASDSYTLDIYSIAGEASEKVSSYKIVPDSDMWFNIYSAEREMFLSADCKTATIVVPCYDREIGRCTMILGLDVSDVTAVREIKRVYVSGASVASRMVDGKLIVTSNFRIGAYPDFDKPEQYLPQVGERNAMKSVAAKDIIIPANASGASYTVVCLMDAQSLEVDDSLAFFSVTHEMYVSKTSVYAMYGYRSGDLPKTDIYRVSYGDGLDVSGKVTVDGYVENRYSVDEYDGVLRVFTTTQKREDTGRISAVCNLFCYDTDSFDLIGDVTDFAPEGDSVRSARFYGDTAYVCTAVEFASQITDPVYAFDLNDYADIKYTNTDTIPGYSLSLKQFKYNTLVGIGYGDSRSNLKIELYGENGSTVDIIDTYEIAAEFSLEYKSYLLDVDNGLIGLVVNSFTEDFAGYLLLHFDGYELKELARIPFELTGKYDARAVCIDGRLYVLGDIHLITFEVYSSPDVNE